jgi:hypothetical protein
MQLLGSGDSDRGEHRDHAGPEDARRPPEKRQAETKPIELGDDGFDDIPF